MSAYANLEARFREMAVAESIAGVLHWDAATCLPEAAASMRGDQLAYLASLSHRMMNDAALADLLAEAEADSSALGDWQQANLREMRHRWLHETCLDEALVEAMTRHATSSEMFWRTAKQENDFKGFMPYLEQSVAYMREVAAAKSEALGCGAYDALLDGFDPGMRCEVVGTLFSELEAFLPDAIAQTIEAQPAMTLDTHADAAKQKALSEALMRAVGFDFTRGRLDLSAHPFCGGAYDDIRITTRYDEADFMEGMFAVLHETGHALYEMQLPEAWRFQPVGEARGMSVHESQSLFVEMQVARSREFLQFAAPIIREQLGIDADDAALYAGSTHVSRGMIRVNADEVTYPTHIILRYRLEQMMLSGELAVADLPDAWGEMQQALLGVRPANDREGCMQDIHWAEGWFGYFPTYTLGALIAAQLMAAVREAIPDLPAQMAKGEFQPLKDWLRQHIHANASRYSTTELVERATGKPLGSEAYRQHITARYLNR